MKIDITLKITPKMMKDAQGNEKKAFVGHLGTHFDVMNKEFPLEYTELRIGPYFFTAEGRGLIFGVGNGLSVFIQDKTGNCKNDTKTP